MGQQGAKSALQVQADRPPASNTKVGRVREERVTHRLATLAARELRSLSLCLRATADKVKADKLFVLELQAD